MYELFDHTADLGLRVEAPDLPALFRDAAEGLFSIIVEQIPHQVPTHELPIRVEAGRMDYLLVDWLHELLYLFETRRLLLDAFEVEIHDTRLRATARARPFDEKRDRLLHEVKAVTYHRLHLEKTRRGWQTELILDI